MQIGKTHWAIPGGCIPTISHGTGPEFISHDKLCVLNTSENEAQLKIKVFYEFKGPVTYELKIKPNRIRKIKFNDLIDPEALILGVQYSVEVESDVPVVIQFTRMDTSSKNGSILGTIAYSQ